MTDRNELERLQPMTTEEKALALVNEALDSRADDIDDFSSGELRLALYSAIERHEADKKAFSDAVQEALDVPVVAQNVAHILLPFILPEPEPDPLVEVSDAIGVHRITLEQALAARGYKIERIEQ